ncbi:LamG domain-containing protein [Pontibacter sp. BT310]|uniref:LamG domain-containing protein n=1 Tax=Pontibacter populi TaxID=890055 RepID=A0ABS6XHD4_9BACT|nr:MULTISPECIES: LamG domain-containing protein [Pontibacter]MBJ6119678.1 LamG domain-containing protein [Pontibacter sp. BT310]MBR0572107.1 LamG domain-containing protein [Microvirga sp. STS03]MBW3366531.1 LamG domain-containing protein [Pontibacter populi]
MKTLLQKLVLFIVFSFAFGSLYAQGSKNALSFDGINDYVFFDYNNRGITNEVTVEAWVKTSASKLQLVTAKYDRDGEHGYQLVMRDGKAAFSGRDGTGEYRISGYSPRIINDNNWHHLAGVCKNGTWSIYIDGVLESQSVTGYNGVDLRSNAPFTVGNYYLVNNDFFQGQIDELKIWKRGLSEAEIRSGMCQTANKSNTDLVVYLKFDEGSGSSLTDHSSYGINGTFRNMNASAAWVVSGAPIGDKSVYLYPNSWLNQQLNLNSSSVNNLAVTSTSSSLKGMHIYTVSSQPNTLSGIKTPSQISDYFGTFRVGTSTSTYTATGTQANAACFRTLYQRAGNTATNWVSASETTNPNFPSFTSSNLITEFALNTSTTGTANL